MPVAHVTADAAECDPAAGAWRADGRAARDGPAAAEPRARRSSRSDVYKSNITPDEIALWKSGDFVNLLSTERINECSRAATSYGALELQRVKHARFTQWIMNIILLLLAIPFVLVRAAAGPAQSRSSNAWCSSGCAWRRVPRLPDCRPPAAGPAVGRPLAGHLGVGADPRVRTGGASFYWTACIRRRT